jgi:hypothetical protein
MESVRIFFFFFSSSDYLGTERYFIFDMIDSITPSSKSFLYFR